MNRKEEIILATLELASKSGLGNVSLQMIADKVGIRKASLFNHFETKDDLIKQMYLYLRDASSKQSMKELIDFDKDVEDILYDNYLNYIKICNNPHLLMFYKIIYSERCFNKDATEIMMEETHKMVASNIVLFKELEKRGKLKFNSVENSALSYSLTMHGFVDYQMDCNVLGIDNNYDAKAFIDNFVLEHKGE